MLTLNFEMEMVLLLINNCYKIYKQKKDISTSLFFTTLKESCVGREYYDKKDAGKMQMSTEIQVKLLGFLNSLSNK